MARHPWELSDEFWRLVEPLVPRREREKGRKYRRKAGGGRKPMPARKAFAGILYVLSTGIQWKALPAEFGSSNSVHRYFRAWAKAGLFLKIWKRGLAEYDEMAGISWRWQSVDGCMTKAPTAPGRSGSSPSAATSPTCAPGARRGRPRSAGGKARRWVVEASHSWMNRFRKLPVRFEKTVLSYAALLHLTAGIIALKKAKTI